MSLDDIKFDNDEDRRKYLSDLARLKKIREEEKLTKERLRSYLNGGGEPSSRRREQDLEIPNFIRDNSNIRNNYEKYYDDNFEDDFEDVSRRRQSPNRRVSNTNKRASSSKTSTSRQINRNNDYYARNNETLTRQANIRQASNVPGGKDISSKKKKRRIGIILFQILALCIIAFGIYIAFLFLNTKEDGFYNVAIFGVDSRDGNVKKNALADVNMIASINRATGEINLVSVYRDSYTEIDGKGTFHKLNEAYFKGGPEQAVSALERNLDIKIDDYATFNWKAVIETINILGGVDLEITEPEFRYINGFITETVNSTGIGSVQLKAPGMQHLDGVQAVAYARLRLMDTDFNRTERQRKVVSLAFDKAKNADFMTLNHILTIVLPQISTSVGLNDMIPFAKNINKYHLGKTAGFPFEKETKVVSKRDYVIAVSLRNNVIALHKFLYGDDINYTPSERLNNLSRQIIKNTSIGENAEENIDIKSDAINSKGYIGNKETKAGSQNENNIVESTAETVQNFEEPSESTEENDANSDKENTTETQNDVVNVEENDDWNTETTSSHKSNNNNSGNGPAFNNDNKQSNTSVKSTEDIEQGPGVNN